jgi:hypothetical protein
MSSIPSMSTINQPDSSSSSSSAPIYSQAFYDWLRTNKCHQVDGESYFWNGWYLKEHELFQEFMGQPRSNTPPPKRYRRPLKAPNAPIKKSKSSDVSVSVNISIASSSSSSQAPPPPSAARSLNLSWDAIHLHHHLHINSTTTSMSGDVAEKFPQKC